MRSVCHKRPYSRWCPNADEPTAVYTCKYCGDSITEGDDYVELAGEYYHEDCFEYSAVEILLEDYGAMKGVAETPEPDCERE